MKVEISIITTPDELSILSTACSHVIPACVIDRDKFLRVSNAITSGVTRFQLSELKFLHRVVVKQLDLKLPGDKNKPFVAANNVLFEVDVIYRDVFKTD